MFNPTFGQAIVTMRPLRSQLWSVGGKYIWLDQMTKELNISCQAMIK
ncbi:MAG: hypothetical protein IM475_02755 [Microcystis sp. M061S2]|nr:hypothetical protein [Microcystis sp. M061S2]